MIIEQYFDDYNGQEVNVYKLIDKIDVLVCTLGATILSVSVPDKDGKKVDVALLPNAATIWAR